MSAERAHAFRKLGLDRSYLDLFCEWLGRTHLLLSLLSTYVVSFAAAFAGEMGLELCASSPWAILIGGCAVPFGVLAAILIYRAWIPLMCDMDILARSARLFLVLTAIFSWIMLLCGSSAMVVETGATLPVATLGDLRAMCPPDPIGLTCWEHRCGGVTRMYLSEGEVLQEYAKLTKTGLYKMWVVPITVFRGAPKASQIAREEIEAFGVQWWVEPPLYWAAEPFHQSLALCNSTAGGICATLLWGNIGPAVRAVRNTFPEHPLRPIVALGDPDQFVDAGRPYLIVGFSLLLAHSVLILLLVFCQESRSLREGKIRLGGGYGRLGPSPPSASEVALI